MVWLWEKRNTGFEVSYDAVQRPALRCAGVRCGVTVGAVKTNQGLLGVRGDPRSLTRRPQQLDRRVLKVFRHLECRILQPFRQVGHGVASGRDYIVHRPGDALHGGVSRSCTARVAIVVGTAS